MCELLNKLPRDQENLPIYFKDIIQFLLEATSEVSSTSYVMFVSSPPFPLSKGTYNFW